MRWKDCSELRRDAYERQPFGALRQRKISASIPPSTWCPGDDRVGATWIKGPLSLPIKGRNWRRLTLEADQGAEV